MNWLVGEMKSLMDLKVDELKSWSGDEFKSQWIKKLMNFMSIISKSIEQEVDQFNSRRIVQGRFWGLKMAPASSEAVTSFFRETARPFQEKNLVSDPS